MPDVPRRVHVLPAGHLPALRHPRVHRRCAPPRRRSVKTEDGTVQVDKELCIGCRRLPRRPAPTACATSTPSTNVAEKCTHVRPGALCRTTTPCPSASRQCGGNARWVGDIDEGYDSFVGAFETDGDITGERRTHDGVHRALYRRPRCYRAPRPGQQAVSAPTSCAATSGTATTAASTRPTRPSTRGSRPWACRGFCSATPCARSRHAAPWGRRACAPLGATAPRSRCPPP